MLDVILTASVSFIISFLAIPVVLQIANQKKLYDVPDERKVHSHPVSSLGGVGIFGGFLLASLLSIQGYLNPEFQYFFAAALVIFFLGLKDDLIILSASKKFVGQVIAASILIHLGGIRRRRAQSSQKSKRQRGAARRSDHPLFHHVVPSFDFG